MRPSFTLIFSFCLWLSAQAQDLQLRTLMGMPASQWETYYNQHKNELPDSTIDRWRAEAITLYTTEKFKEAHQVAEICIRIAALSNNLSLRGTSKLVQAEIYFAQEEYAQALTSAIDAGEDLKKAGNQYQLARSKNRMGVSYQALNEADKAFRAFEESIALKRQLLKDDPSNEVYNSSIYGSLEAYGNALYQFEKYKEAVPVYQEAIRYAQINKNGSGEGAMNYNLGLVNYMIDDAKASRHHFEKSAEIYLAAADTANAVNSYRQILYRQEFLQVGDGYADLLEKAFALGNRMGDKTQVLRLVETCLQPFKRTEEYSSMLYFYNKKLLIFGTNYPDSAYNTYIKIGDVYEKQKKYDDAIALYESMLEALKGSSALDKQSNLYEYLGSVYQSGKEDFKRADQYYQQAADGFRKSGNKAREASALWFKGYNQSVLLKDRINGIATYQKALGLFTLEKDTASMGTMIGNIALTYADLKDSLKSYQTFQQAITLTKKYSDPYYHIGILDKAIDNFDTFGSGKRKLEMAIQRYQFARSIKDDEKSASAAQAVAALLEARKHHAEADKYHDLAIQHLSSIDEPEQLADAYWKKATNLGEVATHDASTAKTLIALYEKSLKYYQDKKDTTNTKTLLCNVALMYRNIGDSLKAYATYDEALSLTQPQSDETNFNVVIQKAATSAKMLGNPAKQIHYLAMKVNHYSSRHKEREALESQRDVAKAYEDRGALALAQPYYEKLVKYFEAHPDTAWLTDSYWNLAYVISEQENKKTTVPKNLQQPLALYGKALKYYVAQRDTANWRTMLTNMAVMYRNMDDSVSAYRLNEEAIALSRPSSDLDDPIAAYQKASESAQRFNHYGKRVKYLEQRLIYANKKQDPAIAAATLEALGKVHEENLKQYRKADEIYQRSLTEYQKAGDKSGMAGTWWNIAFNLTNNFKKLREGVAAYQKSLALYQEIKDSTNTATILNNIGGSYRMLNDSVQSYKYHQLAIAMIPRSADAKFRGDIFFKMAASYEHFKHYGKQIIWLTKQVELYRHNAKPEDVVEAITSLARAYRDNRSDYTRANQLYKEALDIALATKNLDLQANAWWSYAYNLGLMNRDQESIDGYEKAYALFLANKDTSNAMTMRSNVAQTYWGMENFQKAIQEHERAIEMGAGSNNQEMIYKSWKALSDLYDETGNPVKSTEALAKAIGALEIIRDSARLATTYSKMASRYAKAKEYSKSFDYYGKTVLLNQTRRDTASWASALYEWGLALNDKKDYSLAREKVEASLPLYRKIKSKTDEVYSLVWMGILEQSTTNDYKKVEGWYNQAIAVAKPLNNENLLAFCYYQMRYLYRSTGRAALADQNAEKSLALYKKLKNWQQVSNTLLNIGQDAHLVYGDLNKALMYYDQALAVCDTMKDKSYLASVIGARATVFSDQGEFNKALEVIDKSYELYRSLNNEWGIAGTYIDRGNVYRVLSEYELAMKFQGKADSIYLKLGTEYARLAPLANIGENYVSQGNYPKGLEYSMKAYDIMHKAGDEDANMCIIKSNIGDIYYQMGNFVEAEKWLKDALAGTQKAGAKRVKMDILGELGRLKIEQKKYTEAATFLNEGVAIGKETGIVIGYLNNLVLQGKLLVEQKQFEKAKVILEETYTKSKNIGKDNTLWESLYLLGIAYKNTNDLKKSKEYLVEAEKVIEKVRNKVVGGDEARKLFSSDKNIAALYDALVEVLLALGETEEAMTVIQKNNEENLKAKFKGLDVKFENEKKQRALDEERLMKAKLDGIDKQISFAKAQANNAKASEQVKALEGVKTIAETEYLKFVNQQINVQPELSKYFNNSVQPVQFRKVKTKIPKDMALLSYLAGEQQLYIFAATSDTVVAKIVSVPREQLTKDINAMLNIVLHNLGGFPVGESKNESAEREEIVNEIKQTDPMIRPFEDAYHYLIAPVAKEIKGKTKLGVIPTGALNYIPFQLLGKTLSSGKFSLLVNQFAIFYANSTDMLFRNDAEIDKKYNILAFGNPDLSLPSTEKEVTEIKSMFPNAAVFVRNEATEDKAKYAGEEYNVMHFATHGNLDYEDFSQSFITMAGNPSKSEDGKLTLEELWGMEVMNHLNIVVLSACQTAVTKGSNESAAVSPASGFLQNGVKSVVASLWKVDDEATALLMTGFYKNIKTMNPVDALRLSQRTVAANPKFNHPYYWAGFILLGDWR
ncbi:MAG TPA: CHAT domain-containing protein [Cyclobacteriaceae bacterium]|nr:CHAT domain-containing protein [Cyclobacteriaceae bacterium]